MLDKDSRESSQVGFWQNEKWDFSRFLILRVQMFSPYFCWKKHPEKSSMKIPVKILQEFYATKIPDTFLQSVQAKQ